MSHYTTWPDHQNEGERHEAEHIAAAHHYADAHAGEGLSDEEIAELHARMDRAEQANELYARLYEAQP